MREITKVGTILVAAIVMTAGIMYFLEDRIGPTPKQIAEMATRGCPDAPSFNVAFDELANQLTRITGKSVLVPNHFVNGSNYDPSEILENIKAMSEAFGSHFCARNVMTPELQAHLVPLVQENYRQREVGLIPDEFFWADRVLTRAGYWWTDQADIDFPQFAENPTLLEKK